MPLNRTLLAALALSLSVVSCKKDKDNQAPVVDAGPSVIIKTASVDVTGSATDNDGKIMTYFWSQVTGPQASTIASPSGATTNIQFNKSGYYVFQLAVTDDKGAIGVDTVSINVDISFTKVLSMAKYNDIVFPLVLANGTDNSRATFDAYPGSFGAVSWSSGGNTFTQRTILQFSGVPVSAMDTIKSAHLFLYSDPQPTLGNQSDANSGPANALIIQRITDYWSPYFCTWSNLPKVTTDDMITIPLTNQPFLDLDIDLTAMVGKMSAATGSSNYGFLIRLQNETPNNSRLFVSNNNPAFLQKTPRLEVVYKNY